MAGGPSVSRLVYADESVACEQVTFVPDPGQEITLPSGVRVRALPREGPPPVEQVKLGEGMPPKWMNVIKVEQVQGEARPAGRLPEVREDGGSRRSRRG